MVKPLHYYAVVTGDIVGSTHLSKKGFAEVQAAIVRAGDDFTRRFDGRAPSPIELFRGDSWQALCSHARDALRFALFVRAHLKAETGVDTRFAIGVGSVDKMPDKSVGDGRGDAFRISGELADDKRTSRMRFGMAATPDGENEARAISTLLAVLDIVVTQWTSAQARAVRGALLGWKQEEIAAKWTPGAITQQSAGKHLARAGWDGVSAALEYYEEVMSKWSPP